MRPSADRGRSRNHRLRALTALRFPAAALIVLHHSRGYFGIPRNFGAPVLLDQAVAFFFVLSGFVLTYVYPTLDRTRWGPFLWARLARVWPGHAAALVFLVLLLPRGQSNSGHPHSLPMILANLSLVQSWIPLHRFFLSYNGPSWAISTEVFFYLTFPLLIQRFERTWYVKLVVALAAVFGLVTLGNALKLPFVEGDGRIGLDALVYIHPLARWFEFVLGMSAALVWRWVSPRVTLGRWAGTLVELAAFALVVTAFCRSAVWAGLAGRIWWIGPAGGTWLVHGGISCVPFALLIVVMAFERGEVSACLGARVPVLLGEISYPLYLLHQVLLRYYSWRQVAFAGVPDWLAYALFWVLLLIGAHLFSTLVEQPCRELLVRRWPSRPTRPAAASPTDGEAPGGRIASPVRRWLVAELAGLLAIVWLVAHRVAATLGPG